jgi:hypothetical protein
MWVYSIYAKCYNCIPFQNPLTHIKRPLCTPLVNRRRVIQMAKTGVHKNSAQNCKGDTDGVNQKTCILLGHQNINTLMHRKHSTAEYSETATRRLNTILRSLPFTWTIIFCGPARSPILWQSWILNLREVDNQSQPHWPCTRYSSPFCFHTFETRWIKWQAMQGLTLTQASHTDPSLTLRIKFHPLHRMVGSKFTESLNACIHDHMVHQHQH